MKRAENFALGAGLLGLIADLITVLLFIAPGSGANARRSSASTGVLVASMVYGWLIVSWMLVRRSLTLEKAANRISTISGSFVTRYSVPVITAFGILLLPIQFLILANRYPITHPIFQDYDPFEWIFTLSFFSICSLALIGVFLYWVVLLLMPIIYGDIR